MTGYFVAPRIAWGTGAIEELSGIGARRAVVVVDPNVGRTDGDRRVAEELAKGEASVERIVLNEPAITTDAVRALADRLHAFQADTIVAVGGGRTLDAAKSARLLYEVPGLALDALPPVVEMPLAPRSRCVAVPTTSGSGSDASWSADLYGTDGTPIEVAHRGLVPDWALVDPAWARSLGPDAVLDGALEAAAQAVEAYLSAWSNPFSDALAVDVVTTVVRRLPHALRWSDDPDARAALHFAATAAGLAASNAQRGVAHALARALVPETRLGYGRLVGILLPYAADFAHASARDRLEALASAVSAGEEGPRPTLAGRLRRLYDTVRFPTSLSAAGVGPGTLDARRATIVERALRSPAVLANPRVPSGRELEQLLDSALGPSSPAR